MAISGIYHYPGESDQATYDLENAIADPERKIEQFMGRIASHRGKVLADIGAGGGYHACRFAEEAASVYALEPSPPMVAQLYMRVAAKSLANVSVLVAGVEDVPLKNSSVDIAHSRFAYFFGPDRGAVRSCEPGIREVLRILKPDGVFFIVDNRLISGQFGSILERYGYARGHAKAMQDENDQFYESQGFDLAVVESEWVAPDRESLQSVLAMEFPGRPIDQIMGEIEGSRLTYHYSIYWRRK